MVSKNQYLSRNVGNSLTELPKYTKTKRVFRGVTAYLHRNKIVAYKIGREIRKKKYIGHWYRAIFYTTFGGFLGGNLGALAGFCVSKIMHKYT